MSEIVAIGQKEQIIGFQGVGVRTAPVRNLEEFGEALRKAVRNADVEIVLVPENFATEGGEEHIRDARKKSNKVILVIPDHHGSRGLAITEMKEDVEQALGVDMISKGA